MEITWSQSLKKKINLYKWASALAIITIVYKLLEAFVSVFFGLQDYTIVLSGFGLYSFVEVISGIGIWHMIKSMRHNNIGNYDIFEKRALRITGGAFYSLAIGMVLMSVMNIYKGNRPETTFWGIMVSLVSICSMWVLINYKVKIGRELNSQALMADANSTMVCMYLSVILLVSSFAFEITGIGLTDSLGAIGIAVFSFREGRGAFGKAKGDL